MKKILYIIALSVLVISCGGGGDDPAPNPTPTPTVNKAPSAPTQSAPTNNLLCIDNTVTFQWTTSTDPDGDSISYEIQIATDNQFTQNVQNRTSASTSTSVGLDKGVAFYWRVRAKDSKGATSSYSSTFNFYTEGEGVSNHLPFSPALELPEMNSIIQTSAVDLKWTASDIDNDPLTYDVYFGTDNPPATKVAEGITEISFNQALESSKNYYWNVVVKDDKEGITIGQIWSFKTD